MLPEPLAGRLESEPVLVYNISLHGALVRSASRHRVGHHLTFFAQAGEEEIRLDSRVARCEMVRADSGETAYRLALAYPHAELLERARLRQFLVDLFVRVVDEWKRNASTDEMSLKAFPLFSEHTSISSSLQDYESVAFVWHRLVDGTWLSSPVTSPSQPLDGFCVTDDIETDELEMLRQTYQRSEETGRRLVRRLATMATAEKI